MKLNKEKKQDAAKIGAGVVGGAALWAVGGAALSGIFLPVAIAGGLVAAGVAGKKYVDNNKKKSKKNRGPMPPNPGTN